MYITLFTRIRQVKLIIIFTFLQDRVPGLEFTGLGVLCLRYHPSGSHCLNRYVRKSTVAFSVASPYNRYDFGQTTDSCL